MTVSHNSAQKPTNNPASEGEQEVPKLPIFGVIDAIWGYDLIQDRSTVLVLLALAKFANPDGTRIFPSVPTIATMARMTPRNVRLILRKLEENGIINVIEQRRGKWYGNRYNTNSYEINLKKLQGEETVQGLHPLEAEKGAKIDHDADQSDLNRKNQTLKPEILNAKPEKSDAKPETRFPPTSPSYLPIDQPPTGLAPYADASGARLTDCANLRAEEKDKSRRTGKRRASSPSRHSRKKSLCPDHPSDFLTGKRWAWARNAFHLSDLNIILATQAWCNDRCSRGDKRMDWERDWRNFVEGYYMRRPNVGPVEILMLPEPDDDWSDDEAQRWECLAHARNDVGLERAMRSSYGGAVWSLPTLSDAELNNRFEELTKAIQELVHQVGHRVSECAPRLAAAGGFR